MPNHAKPRSLLQATAGLVAVSALVYLASIWLLRGVGNLVLRLFHPLASLANPIAVPDTALWLCQLLIAAAGLMAATVFLCYVSPAQVRPRFSLQIPRDARLWAFAPAFLGVSLVLNYLTSAFRTWLQMHTAYAAPLTVQLPKSGFATFLAFLALCVCPAVLEEILCRGAMQTMLYRWGMWFSVLVTSMLFTLLHQDLAALPAIFILSVLLGFTAHATHSLLPGMLLHFCNNLLSFVLLYTSQKADGMFALGLVVYVILVILVLTIVGISSVVHWRLWRTLRPDLRRDKTKHYKSRTKRLVTSPLFMGTLLLLVLRILLPFVLKGGAA